MRGKLFKHMFLVAMSVFVACTALFMWSLYSYFTEARQSEQREETAYAAAAVEELYCSTAWPRRRIWRTMPTAMR